MSERFASEQILAELPNALVNFIWYLWEVYCDPDDKVSMFILKSGDEGQHIGIYPVGKSIKQNLGDSIDATILIVKDGQKYYMSRP